jgi:hypothetical protein
MKLVKARNIIIINLTPFEPKATRVSYLSLNLRKTLLYVQQDEKP